LRGLSFRCWGMSDYRVRIRGGILMVMMIEAVWG
jgi:hypothetical protein